MKELHIYLDWDYPAETRTNFKSTDMAISMNFLKTIIHTTQTHFCSWKYVNMGYRLVRILRRIDCSKVPKTWSGCSWVENLTLKKVIC